jgi:hypothetical protein
MDYNIVIIADSNPFKFLLPNPKISEIPNLAESIAQKCFFLEDKRSYTTE